MCYFMGRRPITRREVSRQKPVYAWKVMRVVGNEFRSPVRSPYRRGEIVTYQKRKWARATPHGFYAFLRLDEAREYARTLFGCPTVVRVALAGDVRAYAAESNPWMGEGHAGYRAREMKIIREATP